MKENLNGYVWNPKGEKRLATYELTINHDILSEDTDQVFEANITLLTPRKIGCTPTEQSAIVNQIRGAVETRLMPGIVPNKLIRTQRVTAKQQKFLDSVGRGFMYSTRWLNQRNVSQDRFGICYYSNVGRVSIPRGMAQVTPKYELMVKHKSSKIFWVQNHVLAHMTLEQKIQQEMIFTSLRSIANDPVTGYNLRGYLTSRPVTLSSAIDWSVSSHASTLAIEKFVEWLYNKFPEKEVKLYEQLMQGPSFTAIDKLDFSDFNYPQISNYA